MSNKLILSFLFLVLMHGNAAQCYSQWIRKQIDAFKEKNQIVFFENVSMLAPLMAEPRAPMVKISSGRTGAFEYFESLGDRQKAFDVQFGAELPLLVVLNHENIENDQGSVKWGLWIPVSFHVIFGNEIKTAPLINSDNRFGLTFKTYIKFKDNEKILIGVRFTPWMHESPHLGDEFVLIARQDNPNTFRRINVAYEFSELNVHIEFTSDNDNVFKARGGISRLWPKWFRLGGRNKSFYWWDDFEINGIRTTHSKNWIEYYGIGLEARFYSGIGPKESWFNRIKPFVSLDYRNRIQYDFDKPIGEEDRRESYVPSFNLLAGITFGELLKDGRGRFGIFYQNYQGLNPHGQFRNSREYRYSGIGLLLYL